MAAIAHLTFRTVVGYKSKFLGSPYKSVSLRTEKAEFIRFAPQTRLIRIPTIEANVE